MIENVIEQEFDESAYVNCPDCGHPWTEHLRGHLVCLHMDEHGDWVRWPCGCDGDQSGKSVLLAAAHGEFWAIDDARAQLDTLEAQRDEIEG